jgi:hypothetical protein
LGENPWRIAENKSLEWIPPMKIATFENEKLCTENINQFISSK